MATPKNNSVIRAFTILGAFDSQNREMGAAEVASKVGLTPATVHRFLLTLEGVGAVTRTADGRFQLGMTLADLGGRVAPDKVLADASVDEVRLLAEALHETIHVAVLIDHRVVIVASQASTRALRVHTQEGRRLPAYCTALGKVLLGDLDEDGLSAYLDAVPLERHTPATITSADDLRRELTAARAAGFARDREETEEGVRAFSVPVSDAEGTVRAALAVMGPTTRLTDDKESAIIARLAAGARAISARVFHPVPTPA